MWPDVSRGRKTVHLMPPPPALDILHPLRKKELHTGSADPLHESSAYSPLVFLSLETSPHLLCLVQGQTWVADWQIYLLFAFCFSVPTLSTHSWNTEFLPSGLRHLHALTPSSPATARFPARIRGQLEVQQCVWGG